MRKKISFYLSLLLGAIFVVSGFSKVFVYRQFASTIQEVVGVASSRAILIAWLTISAEVVLGSALILRVKLKYSSIALLLLVSTYIWMLDVAVLQEREIVCNCFGILNLRLSNFQEMVLDILLLDALLLLAMLNWGKPEEGNSTIIKHKLSFFLTVAMVVYLEFALLAPAYREKSSINSINVSSLTEAIRDVYPSFDLTRGGTKLVFVLRFHDLDCPLCFDDFIALCDSIKMDGLDQSRRIMAIFRRDETIGGMDNSRLLRWAKGSGIEFPVATVGDSIFDNFGLRKSSVVVITQNRRVLYCREIPIGQLEREKVMSYIMPKNR